MVKLGVHNSMKFKLRKNFRGFFGSFSQKTWGARAFRAPLVLQSLIEYRQQDQLNEAKKLFKHKTFDSSMGFPFSQELDTYWIDTLLLTF